MSSQTKEEHMDQWMPIIWTLIAIVVGVIVLGFIAWVIVARIAAKNFKRVSDAIDRDFKEVHRPFDTRF